MTKKRKSKVAPITDAPKPTMEEIPDDLRKTVAAIKGLVTVHTLLNEGKFEGYKCARIADGLSFVAALHAQMDVEAKAHPKAYLVPEFAGAVPAPTKGKKNA